MARRVPLVHATSPPSSRSRVDVSPCSSTGPKLENQISPRTPSFVSNPLSPSRNGGLLCFDLCGQIRLFFCSGSGLLGGLGVLPTESSCGRPDPDLRSEATGHRSGGPRRLWGLRSGLEAAEELTGRELFCSTVRDDLSVLIIIG